MSQVLVTRRPVCIRFSYVFISKVISYSEVEVEQTTSLSLDSVDVCVQFPKHRRSAGQRQKLDRTTLKGLCGKMSIVPLAINVRCLVASL